MHTHLNPESFQNPCHLFKAQLNNHYFSEAFPDGQAPALFLVPYLFILLVPYMHTSSPLMEFKCLESTLLSLQPYHLA